MNAPLFEIFRFVKSLKCRLLLFFCVSTNPYIQTDTHTPLNLFALHFFFVSSKFNGNKSNRSVTRNTFHISIYLGIGLWDYSLFVCFSLFFPTRFPVNHEMAKYSECTHRSLFSLSFSGLVIKVLQFL